MQQQYCLVKLLSLGIYPAVDPLDSTSRILTPDIVGDEHYDCAQRVKDYLQRYKELQDIIAILGMDELSEEDKLVYTEHVEFNVSYLNLSTLLSNLLDYQVFWLTLKIQSLLLTIFLMENMINIQRLHSTLKVELKK